MKFSAQNLQKIFIQHKITAFLIIGILILIGGGFFAYTKFFPPPKVEEIVEEHELPFDPAGPYALLIPRRDGNAINLNVKRASTYDSFSYQITYNDEKGIDRGAGDLNTWINIQKSQTEFSQEILFGTCSQGYTSGGAHCVFDKGVENGTLELRFKQIEKISSRLNKAKVYKLIIPWHLQKPDTALGVLTSPDTHFQYKIADSSLDNLSVVGFTVIHDLNGLPKLPEGKKVLGKVYTLNVPIARVLSKGNLSIELLENLPSDAKLAKYQESKNDWNILDTKITKNKATVTVEGSAIYTVFVDSSNK